VAVSAAETSTSSPHCFTPLSRRKIFKLVVSISVSTVALPSHPSFATGIDKYVKKKDLDPIETYVPPVLAARDQLLDSKPQLDSSDNAESIRGALRSGAFDGLRDNIRVIGLYAQKAGRSDSASLVKNFFSSLQTYDAALFSSVRYSTWDSDDLRNKLEGVVKAMDDLLDTVPRGALEKSKSVVEKVRSSASGAENGSGGTDAEGAPEEMTTTTKNLDLLF